MEPTKILMWQTPDECKYYDISTTALLEGASLQILRERFEGDYFTKPRELENDRIYRRNKDKIFNLEIAIGDNNNEAFEDMREELEQFRKYNKQREERFEKDQKEWDNIIHILNTDDGAAAVMVLTNRMRNYGERLEIIEIPKYVIEQESQEPAEV